MPGKKIEIIVKPTIGRTSKIILAYFMSVRTFPLQLTRKQLLEAVQVHRVLCNVKLLLMEWREVTLMEDKDNEI